MEINQLVRKNIGQLHPYSCAREEYSGEQAIFLDANENPYDTGYNRYPDPYQRKLKAKLAQLKQVREDRILLGNGSDEIIDLLIRSICEPGEDNLVVFSPGYSMYEVSAAINRVEVKTVGLTSDFLPDWSEMWKQVDGHTKLIFLCTPNNPTGKVIPYCQIGQLCRQFQGLVVVDEAYIDFAEEMSALNLLDSFSNIAVLQTFSKAWGMAGLRLGMCVAAPELIQVLNKVKAPYNVSELTQKTALTILDQYDDFQHKRDKIKAERTRLSKELKSLGIFWKVYDSEANFILVLADESRQIYDYLLSRQVVVRLRDIPPLIRGGIRITIGTKEENQHLLELLRNYRSER